ncbi:ribokinase [Paramesorhizobium deserti]|uniref:Ribokinase n=1 Tax=Paramesorhizobium deserti TaxID=1494590 RepID=A0A135I0A8_9HYPH|nr:ribokinase [Paramesorhizobium deserti]KXF78894.1 ribokinase [Paramesorhizobium deserti]
MITIIGSINLDLIARTAQLPKPGETVSGSDFQTAPGGKGANQALAAARAGAEVRMVGAVGNDAFAAEALALLAQGGVDLARVRKADVATGIALITVETSGENVIVVVPGANGTVSKSDVEAAGLAGGHLLLQHEIPLETVRTALAAARASGTISILNIAPWRDEAADLLPLADIVIANETEFDLAAERLKLEGSDRDERMADFAGKTGRAVIVTLGAEGLRVATPQTRFTVAAYPVTPVDTTGAGDTFCGYLAAGLDMGLGLKDACNRAATAASLACLKQGAQPAIPFADELPV